MGNFVTKLQELSERSIRLQEQVRVFQDRLAGLERDLSNMGVEIGKVNRLAKENNGHLLSISLLEEGRSTYYGGARKKDRRTHTASSYS